MRRGPTGQEKSEWHSSRDSDLVWPLQTCFPDIKLLSDSVRQEINATTVFSFWPEVLRDADEFDVLQKEGCLINSDLGGLAIDPTTPKCRDYIWTNFLKPRYFDKGITVSRFEWR